jgi:hypothetical protein
MTGPATFSLFVHLRTDRSGPDGARPKYRRSPVRARVSSSMRCRTRSVSAGCRSEAMARGATGARMRRAVDGNSARSTSNLFRLSSSLGRSTPCAADRPPTRHSWGGPVRRPRVTAVTWFCANSPTISLNGMSRGARTTSRVMSSSTVRWCMSPLPSELLRGRSARERSVRHPWFGLPGPCGGAVRVARWIHNILRKGRRPCELTSAIRSL